MYSFLSFSFFVVWLFFARFTMQTRKEGMWCEMLLNSLLRGERYDALVHAGATAIRNLLRTLATFVLQQQGTEQGQHPHGVWRPLERLCLGHPHPTVFLESSLTLRAMLSIWLSQPPEPGTLEHDTCARCLALIQAWSTLNVDLPAGGGGGGGEMSFQELWRETSKVVGIPPQTAVDTIQTCRRGAWTTPSDAYELSEVLVAVQDDTAAAAAENVRATCTPDSIILTWCSMHRVRPTLMNVGGPGLCNVGNSCYANSVLQVLFHTDAFREELLRGGHAGGMQASRSTTTTAAATAATTTTAAATVKVDADAALDYARQQQAAEYARSVSPPTTVPLPPLLSSFQRLFTSIALSSRPSIKEPLLELKETFRNSGEFIFVILVGGEHDLV